MAYHKEGTGKTTVERLKAGESSLPAWHKGIGLDSTTSNGVNSITTLDTTPETWLTENPPITPKVEGKKPANK
jgi:hypothetical protein